MRCTKSSSEEIKKIKGEMGHRQWSGSGEKKTDGKGKKRGGRT